MEWFQQQAESGHQVAYMLPLYYLQRGRVAEALHACTALKDTFTGSQGIFAPPGSLVIVNTSQLQRIDGACWAVLHCSLSFASMHKQASTCCLAPGPVYASMTSYWGNDGRDSSKVILLYNSDSKIVRDYSCLMCPQKPSASVLLLHVHQSNCTLCQASSDPC